MSRIDLRSLSMDYPGSISALREIDLVVPRGTFLTIVGPSGSGKSTLLRLVAGLESPTRGQILIDGRPVEAVPPHERGLAMVFQDQAPYPYLDVRDNLAFSLRSTRMPRDKIQARVAEVAGLLGLDGLIARRPGTLSGGERRRVVLGRALAKRPGILLLDEPLTGLDAPLHSSMRELLAGLQRHLGLTVLLVTHDQADALALGHEVAVLAQGRLLQHDRPEVLYNRPATVTVARFVGEPPMNLIPGRWEVDAGGLRLTMLGHSFPVGDDRIDVFLHQKRCDRFILGLRPEHLDISDTPRDPRPSVPARVVRTERAGPEVVVTFQVDGQLLKSRTSSQVAMKVGDAVTLHLDLDRASWFDSATEARL